jgi:hypothetical protein
MGNTLADGDPDVSISARTGQRAFINRQKRSRHQKHDLFWIVIEDVINWVFRPKDGFRHCWNAYKDDQQERYDVARGNDVLAKIFIPVFIVMFLWIVVIALWVPHLVKKI